jgi:hypothetical protein
MYVNKLVASLPRTVFECLVVGPKAPIADGVNSFGEREEEFSEFMGQIPDGEGLSVGELEGESPKGTMYDALVLQLGSFFRYPLYSPASQPVRKQGSVVVLSSFLSDVLITLSILLHFYLLLLISFSTSSPCPTLSS